MKTVFVLLLIIIVYVLSYDRKAVVHYAETYWNKPNHTCGKNTACTPWSYWGSEACGYSSNGGDCANFASQCVLAGGHPELKGSGCATGPCGKELLKAIGIAQCLSKRFNWKSTCGYLMPPPPKVQIGDIIVYHAGSCDSSTAHAAVITSVNGNAVTIACHSNSRNGMNYNYMKSSMPYYEWVLNPES